MCPEGRREAADRGLGRPPPAAPRSGTAGLQGRAQRCYVVAPQPTTTTTSPTYCCRN